MKVLVTQLYLTLCNPMDCSPPGSSIHGILGARILEGGAGTFSRESSWSRDWTQVSCIYHLSHQGSPRLNAGPQRIDALELWCWRRPESPLDCSEIKAVNPEGDQSWVFIGRTEAEAEAPTLGPPNVKSLLAGKDPDAGKDWGQEEKGTTEDETVGWHHRLDGHEFEQAPEHSEGQGSWGQKESDFIPTLTSIQCWYKMKKNKTHTNISHKEST